MASRLALLLLSLLALLPAVLSLSNNASSSPVFVYRGSDDTEFVFALNVDKSTDDIYFHLSSPAGNTWVGVGMGSNKMAGSLFLIAYPAANNHDVTISPRIATGHSEPTYQSDLKIEKLSGNGLTGANSVSGSDRQANNIVADGVCRGCAKWNGGSLDYGNSQQPFIFAVGPVFPEITSDSLSAGLSRHIFYGQFTMDMRAAVSGGNAVPLPPYNQKFATRATHTESDNDPAPRIHGLVMSLVFIVLLPLGSLVLRVWNKVKGHIIVQCLALVLFCMAFAGGLVISMQYNRSKNVNSAHQIIGILLLLALLSQTAFGAINHRIFKKEQRKTIFGKIHLFLGPAIILFGIINGALGFRLAGAPILAIPYAIIVLIFVAAYGCIRGGTFFCRRRRGGPKPGPEGYQYPQFGGPQAPQYGGYQQAPTGYPPPYAQQDVPLTRFGSSHSVLPRADEPAAQPRPMI